MAASDRIALARARDAASALRALGAARGSPVQDPGPSTPCVVAVRALGPLLSEEGASFPSTEWSRVALWAPPPPAGTTDVPPLRLCVVVGPSFDASGGPGAGMWWVVWEHKLVEVPTQQLSVTSRTPWASVCEALLPHVVPIAAVSQRNSSPGGPAAPAAPGASAAPGATDAPAAPGAPAAHVAAHVASVASHLVASLAS